MRRFTYVFLMLLGATPVGSGSIVGDPDKGQAAEWIAGLIKQLGDPKFAKREAAGRELTDIGEPALVPLRKAAAATDPEIQARVERVIAAISRRVTTRELEKLQGTWSLVSYDSSGNRLKGEDKGHLFVFKGDEWVLQINGLVFQGGTVQRIEVKEKVNAIDLLITQGATAGVTAVSIYAIDGDALKYVNSGEPRATEFVTKPGDGRHYLTFRRSMPPGK